MAAAFELEGRVALVTGGARGIGRAICVALGRAGALVAVNYRSREDAARETVRLVEEAGGRALPLPFDVSDPEACRDAIDGLAREQGRLDILVNNAGISIDGLLLRVTQQDFQHTMAVNVGGALWCSKAAIRWMMRARRGRIVNLSSVVGEVGNPGQAVYSASKAAIVGLTKSLAREYASRGVTVNAVAPGYIETDMTATLPQAARDAFVEQTPLGRPGTVEDVAAAVHYLVSEEASFVTGQVLRVNGGMAV